MSFTTFVVTKILIVVKIYQS